MNSFNLCFKCLLLIFLNVSVSLAKTEVNVVEIKNLKFKADSFFDDRAEMSSQEIPVSGKYLLWSEEAISQVNNLLPLEAQIPTVKIKLIFEAEIKDSKGIVRKTPISLIESYQEPQTQSIRLGMAELINDKESFQLTVAHEYAHLVFENVSRQAKTTAKDDHHIKFWPKSIYEGTADLLMGLALKSDLTASRKNWSSKNLQQFKNLKEAQTAPNDTVIQARAVFTEMKLIPTYPIYSDWLEKVERFIRASGGVDPYAEGRWLAGSLLKKFKNQEGQTKLVLELLKRARSGQVVSDIQKFHDELVTK